MRFLTQPIHIHVPKCEGSALVGSLGGLCKGPACKISPQGLNKLLFVLLWFIGNSTYYPSGTEADT